MSVSPPGKLSSRGAFPFRLLAYLLTLSPEVDRIRAAVLELPDRQRAAVLMHKYEELDYQQIATALDCSPQAVKSLLFRAYTALRETLEGVATAA